ncbi:MAG: zinc metalloprotease [Actinomycetes bacterium]
MRSLLPGRAPSYVVFALCLAALGLAAPAGTATAGADHRGVCVDERGQAAGRAKAGSPDHRDVVTSAQFPTQADAARLAPLAAGSVNIDTVFHVITDHALSNAETARYTRRIGRQMDVLNAAFAGMTAPDAADTPFRFTLVATTYTVNSGWARMALGSNEELAAKRALRQGGISTLNVYAADPQELFGWATYPGGREKDLFYDGVVIWENSMPGGTLPTNSRGDTANHEVGHWLGLLHTFDNGCTKKGDLVADTAAERSPAAGCPTGRDTCRAPGLDPIHNFMDYSDDTCLNHFTPGQSQRMSDQWQEFRA